MVSARHRVFAAALLAFVLAPVGARAETRGLIELFTSQGCSSCPAADRLLAELKQDPSLVVVSLPVPYWDYIGWKDTLADPRHSARQSAYSRIRGDREVYTPQVVVNGIAAAPGSDHGAIDNAVLRSRGTGTTLPVALQLSAADGRLSVTAGSNAVTPASGEVWLLGLTSSIEVAIRRGENTGRTLTYSNVVRRWLKLGDWSGGSRTWNVPVGELRLGGVDAVAVIVQSGTAARPGAVLGAALTHLDQ